MARIAVVALDADLSVEVDGVRARLQSSHSGEFSFNDRIVITVITAEKPARSDSNVSDPVAGTGAFDPSLGA